MFVESISPLEVWFFFKFTLCLIQTLFPFIVFTKSHFSTCRACFSLFYLIHMKAHSRLREQFGHALLCSAVSLHLTITISLSIYLSLVSSVNHFGNKKCENTEKLFLTCKVKSCVLFCLTQNLKHRVLSDRTN